MKLHSIIAGIVWAAAAITAVGDSFQVETLADTHAGEIVSLDETTLVAQTAQGIVETSIEDLLELRCDDRTSAGSGAGEIVVELSDGSTVPFDSWRREGDAIHFKRIASGLRLTTSLDSLACWRAMPISSDSEEQEWEAIRRSGLARDFVVIRRAMGDPLDYVEGAILDVSPDGVLFELDQREVTVGWGRVFALVFARPPETNDMATSVVLRGEGGLRFTADRLELTGSMLRGHAGADAAITVDLSAVESLDFSQGKRHFLSDLEQLSVQWTPVNAPPRFPELGLPRRDADFSGNPITLRFSDDRLPGAWRLREFSRGIAMRSRTELTLALPEGMNRLGAWVGVDPAASDAGAAEVSVLADDVPLARFDVSGEDEPYRLSETITGARRLTIVVDYGDNFDTGDLIHIADACVTK